MFGFLRPSGPQPNTIAPAEAVARAASGEMVVIDVRDAGEIRATGKARGALHVPLTVLRMKLDPASPERLPGITTPRQPRAPARHHHRYADCALLCLGWA